MRQASGVEEEEGEAEEEEEREDDAQGLDEGFKEDDQGSSEGARKGGLTMTREWLDLMFYDSEEDGDEGFDEGGEEQLQPRVGEGDEWRGRRLEDVVEETGGEQSLRACTGSGRIGMRKDKEEETLRGLMREGRVRQE